VSSDFQLCLSDICLLDDFLQRQGCVHGEELPYVFGAPLVGGLSHFPRNYTKAEVQLSEAVMIYWSNFARTG
jgi:neuroligin